MLSIRVYFKKKGILSYISHLDLNRTIMRAIQRAEIPIVYSEGFNPHPRLVFTQPLSLFHESETEIFDFRLEHAMNADVIYHKLKSALPEAVEIVKVTSPIKKLSEIAFAEYNIDLIFSKDIDLNTVAEINNLLSGEIIVRKKTKKSEKDIDISPMIKKINIIKLDGSLRINTILDTSSTIYLNPIYIVNYLENYFHFDDISINRLKFFDAEMNEFE